MKLNKLFLVLITAGSIVPSVMTMEGKTKKLVEPRNTDEISTDELRTILIFALNILKSQQAKVTEAELFKTINSLRLANKKFNSLFLIAKSKG